MHGPFCFRTWSQLPWSDFPYAISVDSKNDSAQMFSERVSATGPTNPPGVLWGLDTVAPQLTTDIHRVATLELLMTLPSEPLATA